MANEAPINDHMVVICYWCFATQDLNQLANKSLVKKAPINDHTLVLCYSAARAVNQMANEAPINDHIVVLCYWCSITQELGQ
jgi:hypothetical protein